MNFIHIPNLALFPFSPSVFHLSIQDFNLVNFQTPSGKDITLVFAQETWFLNGFFLNLEGAGEGTQNLVLSLSKLNTFDLRPPALLGRH